MWPVDGPLKGHRKFSQLVDIWEGFQARRIRSRRFPPTIITLVRGEEGRRQVPGILFVDHTMLLSTQPEQIQDASFYTEIRAGLTTFATMAYIIAVNVCEHPTSIVDAALLTFTYQADILSETGGTCVCHKPLTNGYCANEAEWQSCANGEQTSSSSTGSSPTALTDPCSRQKRPDNSDSSTLGPGQHPLWILYQSPRGLGV